MVTGASRAEAALLVIDANEGVMENSKRYGYLLSMLGIKQIAVVVNKMDLVDYSKRAFDAIIKEYSIFLKKINIRNAEFIPVSGIYGDNVVDKGNENMPWYEGLTVLEQLDAFKIHTGDEIAFYPSGKTSRVKSIESFNTEKQKEAAAGFAVGLTLADKIYITRGELAVRVDETPPKVARRIKANIFWLGKKSLTKGKEYYIKIGSAKVKSRLSKVIRVLDASNLQFSEKESVERHEVAECIFELNNPIAFDLAEDIANTSRFVIVDNYEIAGGGIIIEGLHDDFSDVQK